MINCVLITVHPMLGVDFHDTIPPPGPVMVPGLSHRTRRTSLASATGTPGSSVGRSAPGDWSLIGSGPLRGTEAGDGPAE